MKILLIAALLAGAAAIPAAAAPAPAPAPVLDCIVQYEVIIDGESMFDTGTIYSRGFVLPAKDCPAPNYRQDAYNISRNGGSPKVQAPAEGAKGELGKTMAIAYAKWLWTRKFPIKAGEMRDIARMHVLPATPYYRALISRRPGASTYFIDVATPGPATKVTPGAEVWPQMKGVCLDYQPTGPKPLAVLGGAQCRTWVK
ncbi:MAG: hypothetical protein JWM33_1083 [Caulobacteraceae bacterium]|nr:hypothetical protein [Caulobacteraceae bacterium]